MTVSQFYPCCFSLLSVCKTVIGHGSESCHEVEYKFKNMNNCCFSQTNLPEILNTTEKKYQGKYIPGSLSRVFQEF